MRKIKRASHERIEKDYQRIMKGDTFFLERMKTETPIFINFSYFHPDLIPEYRDRYLVLQDWIGIFERSSTLYNFKGLMIAYENFMDSKSIAFDFLSIYRENRQKAKDQ